MESKSDAAFAAYAGRQPEIVYSCFKQRGYICKAKAPKGRAVRVAKLPTATNSEVREEEKAWDWEREMYEPDVRRKPAFGIESSRECVFQSSHWHGAVSPPFQ